MQQQERPIVHKGPESCPFLTAPHYKYSWLHPKTFTVIKDPAFVAKVSGVEHAFVTLPLVDVFRALGFEERFRALNLEP